MKVCPSGKKTFDKLGATTLKNLTFKLHHIKMDVYSCPRCHFWHLTSVGKKRHFRHKYDLFSAS